MKNRGRALAVAFGIAAGLVSLGFLFGYFVLFSSFVTPPGCRDGQCGLAEVVRLEYSLEFAAVCAATGLLIALQRFWPRKL